ncbi:MAG: hypothetical protein LC687_05890 [Actinobacteria bacterium]|nr:hypothetical protein [Actinomycetota bacterium]
MQNQQSNLQGQTGQPAPNAQDPQAPTNSNLQQTLDLQSIDSSQSSITVPGSDNQATTTTIGQDSSASNTPSPLLNFDVSTSLLVTVFVAAVVIVVLLVKIAKPKHELYPEADRTGDVEPIANQTTDSQVNSPTPGQKKTSNKKMTRRQRRASSKSNTSK